MTDLHRHHLSSYEIQQTLQTPPARAGTQQGAPVHRRKCQIVSGLHHSSRSPTSEQPQRMRRTVLHQLKLGLGADICQQTETQQHTQKRCRLTRGRTRLLQVKLGLGTKKCQRLLVATDKPDDLFCPGKHFIGPALFADVFKEQVQHMSCAWDPCQLWKPAWQAKYITETKASLVAVPILVCCWAAPHLCSKMAPACLLS